MDDKCGVCMARSSFEGLGGSGREPRDDGTGSVLEYPSYTRPFNLVCLVIRRPNPVLGTLGYHLQTLRDVRRLMTIHDNFFECKITLWGYRHQISQQESIKSEVSIHINGRPYRIHTRYRRWPRILYASKTPFTLETAHQLPAS